MQKRLIKRVRCHMFDIRSADGKSRISVNFHPFNRTASTYTSIYVKELIPEIGQNCEFVGHWDWSIKWEEAVQLVARAYDVGANVEIKYAY